MAGPVTPPRVDVANEDLVRAHVQAMWLAASQMSLGRSLLDVLDMEDDPPSLELSRRVKDELARQAPKDAARGAAAAVLSDLTAVLSASNWYGEGWIDDVLRQLPKHFNDGDGPLAHPLPGSPLAGDRTTAGDPGRQQKPG